jgi:hypothetical protein
MAIIQISRIQHRRGLDQDLPNLASAELGWSIDKQKLYIGNGTLAEGAPVEGVTEILTEISPLFEQAKYQFKGEPAGFIANTSGTTAPIERPLQEKLDDFVNVRDFGAKGDGQTDDTAAINRALNNAFAYSTTIGGVDMHRTVYFPAGVYLIKDIIETPPFIKIQGDGKLNTLLRGRFKSNGADIETIVKLVDNNGNSGEDLGIQPGTIVPQATNYIFSDIGFDNQTTSSTPCVIIDGGSMIHFERVSFLGRLAVVGATGKSLVNITNISEHIGAENITFSRCDFQSHGYGVEIGADVVGVSLTDCSFKDLYQDLYADSSADTFSVRTSIYDNVTNNVTDQTYVDRRGSSHIENGKRTTLAGATTSNITEMLSTASYKHLVMSYTIKRGTEFRTGTLRASGNGTNYYFQDDYVESSDINITLTVNSSTGVVGYVSTGGSSAELTYSLNYHL